MKELGQTLFQTSFVIRGGDLTITPMLDLVAAVVDRIDMTTVYGAEVHSYPALGKGGNGFTIYQPITESFIVLDAWPDHKGAYLLIGSCKWYDKQVVQDLIEKRGLRITQTTKAVLSLTEDTLEEQVGLPEREAHVQ